MGKAARWLRGLLGGKKPDSSSDNKPTKEKRRWSFVRSYREKHHSNITTTNTNYNRDLSYIETVDPNKHAIAVAAATAAVAEAAVAAAQAAAAVVRLTSSGRANTAHPAYVSGVCGVREERAAVKIQASFRGYLSRRALRALKALVKLQALVRGHIVRKQTADMVRRMQALLRAQARARAGRTHISESPLSSSKSFQYHNPGPATPEKFEHNLRARSMKHDQSAILKRNASKSSGRVLVDQDKAHSGWNWFERNIDSSKPSPADDEKSDKILEIDPGKPHFTSRRRNLFQSDQNSHSFTTSKDSTTHQTLPSPSSYEVQSLTPLKFRQEVEEASFCTADNSPQFFSASSRGPSSKRGPFTPTKSDGSMSFLSGYSDHPNYMANTESSRAKVRSLSAPKQRPHFEKSSSAKRYSVHGFGHRVSALQANFTTKAYPGSGRLDRLGMPVIGSANSGFSDI